MRTGAIFARGSCRALKWMALFGVVFALGAVDTAAQLSDPRLTIEATDAIEGGSTTVTVTMSAEVQPDPDTTDATDHTYVLGLTVTPEMNTAGMYTPADAGDWTIADDVSNVGGSAANLELKFENTDRTDSERKMASATFVLHTLTPDDDAEHEDLTLTVTLTPGSEQGLSVVDPEEADRSLDITIMDNDFQTYVLALEPDDQEPMEGGDAVTVSVKAVPAHVQGSKQLTLNLDMPAPAYDFTIEGVTGDSVTLGDLNTDDDINATEAQNMAMITVTHPKNDQNRVDTTLTLSAWSGQPGNAIWEGALPIVLTDANKLPMITAELVLLDGDGMPVRGGEVTDGMVTEGMDYELTLTVVDEDGDAMKAAEDLTVVLTASGTASSNDDYSLATNMITIAMGDESSAAVKLEVDLNDDLGNESLMLGYRVAGESMYGTETSPPAGMDPASLLGLTIGDATQSLVWVKDGAAAAIQDAITDAQDGDGAINLRDYIDIPKSALFEAYSGYSVEIALGTSDRSVATVYDGDAATNYDPVAGHIRVVPRAPGHAKITLTGSAVGPSSAVMDRQVSVDVAEITFDVTVELAVPGTPQILSPDERDGHVVLSWDAPTSGGAVASYEYDQDASDEWTSTGTARTATVTGLTNGEKYIFRVRARNASGVGEAARVEATPMATPVDASQVVTVKSVSAATIVDEAGGLEVTVTATVPAGTKGADDKVAPIASKQVIVSFPTDEASIMAGEDADAGELTALGATNGYMYTWEKIARTEKASEATYKFRVAVGQDLDAEDEKFQVMVAIDGDGKRSKVVTIDDAEVQTYVLSLPAAAKGAITEGKSAKLTLEAKPKRTIDIPVTLALEPNDPSRYTLSAANGTFGITSFETTVSAKADSNRDDDTLTVTAYTDRHGEFASLDITVKDANALPAVEATLVDKDGKALDPQPESVMEGETVKVMLTAVDKDGKAMKAAEKLTITLMPTGTADAADYRLSSQSFEIAKDKESSAAVDLMITEDQDIGDETLMFDAAVGGEAKNGTEKRSVAGVLSLMITDGTQKLVYAKTQEEVEAAIYAAKNAGAGDDMTFTAGEMIEVMGSALFSSAEGVTLSYTAESSMSGVASASVSGGTVMVTAVAEGMTDITITAHASMASGVKILDQTDPGMASVTFPVDVGLEALSIELKGPEDMNLAEDMSAMVTATANRAVTADTMVMLMRDRAMSTAGDDDYTAEAITISAGEMTGSTTVMAVEDNMAEDMEELVLYGMTEGMAGEVTGEVKLYLWDAAVPALPLIAQLLLASFLAVGGYRRYRRR